MTQSSVCASGTSALIVVVPLLFDSSTRDPNLGLRCLAPRGLVSLFNSGPSSISDDGEPFEGAAGGGGGGNSEDGTGR
jgi:hypothetical protein